MAHTLKSNAAQVGKNRLQNIAAIVERLLKNGRNDLTNDDLDTLEAELNTVLQEFAVYAAQEKRETSPITRVRALETLTKLDVMLAARNPTCQSLLGELRVIPGAEKLATLVEDFAFKEAIAEIDNVKKAVLRWK